MTIGNNTITIESMEFIDNKILVGTTKNGIFQSIDGGVTWQNTIGNTFPITGFVKKGNNVYAGSLGSGVYVYDAANANWLPFNNGLRLNEAGSVSRIASSNKYLFIVSGGNGGYHTYNFDNNAWEVGYFYGSLSPGLVMNDLENRGDTITVVNGKRVIKSVDAAISWSNDHIDARNGVDRIIYNGSNEQYLITNALAGGAWFQQRNKYAPTGTSWADDEEFIPNLYVYNMLEHQGKLFLATHQGLYTNDQTLSVNEVDQPSNIHVQCFPNPVHGDVITVSATEKVRKYVITDHLGQIVHDESIGKSEFTMDADLPNGVYFVAFSFDTMDTTVKKVIIRR
jgi:hypothetical protein